LAPLTLSVTGVPSGTLAKWKLAVKLCWLPWAGLGETDVGARTNVADPSEEP
jgi:hypothetical protein